MFPFEKLEVYGKAFQVNLVVYRFVKYTRSIPFYTKNQFGKACLSIMLNIAEGTAKFSKREGRNFYVIARGSTFECGSVLKFLYDAGEIETELKENLSSSFEEISRILYTMIKNLEN